MDAAGQTKRGVKGEKKHMAIPFYKKNLQLVNFSSLGEIFVWLNFPADITGVQNHYLKFNVIVIKNDELLFFLLLFIVEFFQKFPV